MTTLTEIIKAIPPKISYLFTVDNDPKTSKGRKLGYVTAILYMLPAKLSGIIDLCKYASLGCAMACLNSAGRGAFNSTQNARKNKTIWYVKFKGLFWKRAIKELQNLDNRITKLGLKVAVRFNGTSDQPIERIRIKDTNSDYDGLTILESFPHIQFYDYTKYPYATRPNETLPENYHLTYSRSEDTTQSEMELNLSNGRNVAVVMDVCKLGYAKSCHSKCECPFPKTWHGYDVINGDLSDLRFLDPTGVIVALHAKGKAQDDQSNFVVNALTDINAIF